MRAGGQLSTAAALGHTFGAGAELSTAQLLDGLPPSPVTLSDAEPDWQSLPLLKARVALPARAASRVAQLGRGRAGDGAHV
jgi:hypothetical protein